MDKESIEHLIHTFITSKLDLSPQNLMFNSSLLHGLPDTLLQSSNFSSSLANEFLSRTILLQFSWSSTGFQYNNVLFTKFWWLFLRLWMNLLIFKNWLNWNLSLGYLCGVTINIFFLFLVTCGDRNFAIFVFTRICWQMD